MNFRNFKVRINAAVALAVPNKREYYKQFYQPIFVSLVKGLETSQNMEDFNEYKHRDNLIEQVIHKPVEGANYITISDLPYFRSLSNFHNKRRSARFKRQYTFR